MRTLALCALLTLALGLGACDDKGDPGGGGSFPTLTPYYDADYLSSYTEVADCRLSGPHPNYMQVHIFPSSEASFYVDRVNRQNMEFPEGTIIVKTEFSDFNCASTPWRITAMRKGAAGTAPATGDWEWQEFDYRSQQEREGPALASCLNSCHDTSACSEYDFTCVEP